jgi:hypothetical protein
MILSCLGVDEASQLHLYPNQGRHDHLFIKEADCQVITISIQPMLRTACNLGRGNIVED